MRAFKRWKLFSNLGSAREGMTGRLVRVCHTSDCAAIGYTGAQLSGSGIAIGLQSRGTAIIHKFGLPRLHNLELFSFSPSLTLQTFEAMGRNAAKYARSETVIPVPVIVDNWARLRFIVKTALLHRKETEAISRLPPHGLGLLITAQNPPQALLRPVFAVW